jgi:hypothetical protein
VYGGGGARKGGRGETIHEDGGGGGYKKIGKVKEVVGARAGRPQTIQEGGDT